MSATEVLLSETRQASRILRLNRPRLRNALNAEMVDALLDALSAAESDASVRAVILTGSGEDFCAGADLHELTRIAERSFEENLADSRHLAGLFRRIHLFGKPVLALVHGNALAGGSGLACVCDYVLAHPAAKFGFTEARIGFVAAIVSRFLVDRVGPARARDLLLSARRIPCQEALDLGLVDQVVEGDLLEAGLAKVAKLAGCSASSLALTKQLLAELPGRDLEQALDLAARLNAQTRATEDCREGIRAFLEKRKPRWVP